jgi:hypothetical protein
MNLGAACPPARGQSHHSHLIQNTYVMVPAKNGEPEEFDYEMIS